MTRVCKKVGTIMVVDVAIPIEKRGAFNDVEKLRDPSHTSACTPEELLAMANGLKMTDIKSAWYKVEMELEKQIASSFPKPGDDDKIREILRADIEKNNVGMGAHWAGDTLYIVYPSFILAGKRTA